MVPNVKHVQLLSVFELAAELSRKIDAAMAGRLSPLDVSGGTFTLSNIGNVRPPRLLLIILILFLFISFVFEFGLSFAVQYRSLVRTVTRAGRRHVHDACDPAARGGHLRHRAGARAAALRRRRQRGARARALRQLVRRPPRYVLIYCTFAFLFT